MSTENDKDGISALNIFNNAIQSNEDDYESMPSLISVQHGATAEHVETADSQHNEDEQAPVKATEGSAESDISTNDIDDNDFILPISNKSNKESGTSTTTKGPSKEDKKEPGNKESPDTQDKLKNPLSLKQKIVAGAILLGAGIYYFPGIPNTPQSQQEPETIQSETQTNDSITPKEKVESNDAITGSLDDDLSVPEVALTLPDADELKDDASPGVNTDGNKLQTNISISSQNITSSAMPKPSQAFGTVALSMLTKKVDGQYDELNEKVVATTSKIKTQNKILTNISSKVDDIERIQMEMLAKKKEFSRPVIKQLLIAKPTYCEYCDSMASFSHKGGMVLVSNNDTFLDFNVLIKGDRLILKNDDVQYSFFARP